MQNELGPRCFPKRQGVVTGEGAKRHRAAKKHMKRVAKCLNPITNLGWGSVCQRFRDDAQYRRNLMPKGWSDDNIHMLEDLGNSEGQNPASSYNHEAARMAARRTNRFESGAEQLAWRRGEEQWWPTSSGTHASTEWNDWHSQTLGWTESEWADRRHHNSDVP